ncbi:glucose-6-phosphate 1-dehydrogenase 4, chloroplastic isoform X2 [Iris pallida]|uniref:Glucose-6-phosphate 1-dehydrogenase 4, chloroplastic isoform X2 n=1 Tax=Iris pallida TaxID=29817 RepID=A0AAX6E930_IRIPA|nr:glucose-6-phosphate 1-dehydrogenase 4, chloroplastic isoform X2 [Iris pallida]
MALPFFPAAAGPSYASGHLPVGSTYLLSSFDCCCMLPRSTAIDPRVCGLRPCVLGILKHRKASRRHGWERKSKSLEIQGKDPHHHHLEASLSSEGKHNEDVQLNDSAEESTSTISQDKYGFSSNYHSAVPKGLESPKGSPSSLIETSSYAFDHSGRKRTSLCIAVIGATGELARNKVFPALFALYYSGFLPEDVGIFGYSRKQLSDEDLRSTIAETLTCRVDHRENCGDKLDAFLGQTYHLNGGYDNREGMKRLNSLMGQSEGYHEANRIFYLSVPQEALVDAALSVADNAQTKRGWNRIIIEKPFGFDALTSYQLTRFLLSKFEERQIYRIDHLLGKDLIENLTVLRFSNLVFEPLWTRTYIRSVQVIFSEEYGIESRGRYLGGCGIIRDIIHSHILQTISLFAMEPPVSLDGEDIRDEKVKVLRSIRKLELDDIVLGQHKASSTEKIDPYMDSLTPTFFAAALYIDNARWDGVPFLIKAGMGLTKHRG